MSLARKKKAPQPAANDDAVELAAAPPVNPVQRRQRPTASRELLAALDTDLHVLTGLLELDVRRNREHIAAVAERRRQLERLLRR